MKSVLNNKLLLVEGIDDQHVIWALCKKYNVKETFNVKDCKGIDKLLEQIPLRFKESDIETIGIIVDADQDLKSRWESLKYILTNHGYNVPNELPFQGLIISNNIIKVGVWIMPDNNLNGMLEDFVTFLIPKEDKLLPIINSTIEDIENKKLNKYPTIYKSKAIIHNWLSLQEDPGTPMGLSITKRYLTTEEENCQKLLNWINDLYK